MSECRVPDLVGVRGFERLHVGLSGDHESVAVRAERGCHDRGDAHSRLRSHQRGQRLMLHLLESPHGGASRRIPVREQAPSPGDALRVLRVPSQESNLQRASGRVVADVLRVADALPRRRHQVARDDPECEGGGADLLGRRHAGRRAEREANDRTGPEPEREPCQSRGRGDRAEHHGAQGRERDEPRRQHSDRPHELRANDHEYRCRCGQPELGVAPAREHMGLDREPVRLNRATEDARGREQDSDRCEQIARKAPAATDKHCDDDDERKPEGGEERDAPERLRPSEHRCHGVLDCRVLC